MNQRILSTLGFDKVKQQLLQFIVTAQGTNEVSELLPIADENKIQSWLNETQDGLKVQRLRGGIPIPKLENIQPHMKRIEIGADLNGIELAQVGRVLSTTSELTRFFDELSENEVDFERLYMWREQLEVLPELNRQLKQAIDDDGYVTDEASPALKAIRQNIRRSEQTIREELDSIIRGKNARYLSDALVTMRNERYVIPVKQEYLSLIHI